MTNKKIKIILIIVLVVLVISLGIVLYLNYRSGNDGIGTDYSKLIDEVTKLYINGGTKEELEEVMGYDNIESINIITGPDSYTREAPSSQVIKENDLKDYVAKADNLSRNLEKKIKDNFEYKIESHANDVNKRTYVVNIKSYFYYVYMFDLNNLRDLILSSSGMENNEANQYKAKVKAMEIIDRNLNTYENKNDEVSGIVTVNYKSKKKTGQSLYSYLLTIEGENYLHNNDTVTNLMTNQNQRIQDYYNFGLQEGILNPNNLLAL